MLPPDIISLGPIHLRWYGLMLGIAFILCLELGYRRARKHAIPTEFVSSIAFWGLIIGLVGARVGYILSHTDEFALNRPFEWIAIWHGGQTFYGGLAGGLIAVAVLARRHGAGWWYTTDFLAPLMPLGHAIGRTGCFLRGCCFGTVSGLPWAIRFPKHVDAGGHLVGSDVYIEHLVTGKIGSSDQWSLPVHPTQLYSVAALLALSVFLWWLYDRRSFDGQVSAVYLVGYGAVRFMVEFLRTEPSVLLRLTAWQWISVGLMGAGVLTYFRQRKRRQPDAERPAQSAARS